MEGFTILDQIPEVQAVPSEVQLADAWHFGSCTKAVTATLAPWLALASREEGEGIGDGTTTP